MSYLKLCQISNDSLISTIYLEDCDSNVIINQPIYPLTLNCEIIEWVDENAFLIKGESISRNSAKITLAIAPSSIRQTIFNQLQATYSTLVI